MKDDSSNKNLSNDILLIDNQLSKRFIALDPKGYFLIKINNSNKEIIVEHYSNYIDDLGVANDPETGEPLTCSTSKTRIPIKIYKGKTAKEIGIQITEGNEPFPISCIDHAMYLGRELQKAETAIINGSTYIQD